MTSFPLVITLVGLVTTALYLPLVLGKVKPNRFYGIRTPEAFSSEENWYRINKSGAKALLPASIVLTLVGLIGFLIPSPYFIVYEIAAAIIILGSILVTCWRMLRTARGK
jgi:uncharacterized membrane protein